MASFHRQNSEDSEAGYPEAGCGDDRINDGCGGGLTGGKAMAAMPTSSDTLALDADPDYRLARLSELMVCSGSVVMSCRSPVRSCINLHKQVSERSFRTGRNPGSI